MALKDKKYKEQQDILAGEKAEEYLPGMPVFMRDFIHHLRNKNVSEKTVLAYMRDLDLFFYYLETEKVIETGKMTPSCLENLSYHVIESFAGYVRSYKRNGKDRTNEAKGVRRKMTSVKSLYAYLIKNEDIKRNPADKYVMMKDSSKGKVHVVAMSRENVQTLYNAVRKEEGLTAMQRARNKGNELRDNAIITLFLNSGIRVSELVGLDLEDVSMVNGYIRVIRKRDKTPSIVHVNRDTLDLLDDYIQNGRKNSETDPEALFISRNGGRITVRSVERLVEKYIKAAQLGAGITVHGLRRTHGTLVYKETLDLNTVAARLGHASIEVAYRAYVASDEERDRKASELKI